MKIDIGDYLIESDSLQFVVSRKSIVQEGKFTKAENIGKETFKPIAYAVKFEEILRYIPQDTIRNNEDINIIKEKLDLIRANIEAITEYPTIFIKEEKKSELEIEEIEKEEV